MLFKHAFENLRNYFSFSEPTQILEITLRFQYLFLLLLLVFLSRQNKPLMLTGLFLLLSNLFIVIIFYDVSRFRDYRFLSPFLLLALVIIIMHGQTDSHRKKIPLFLFLLSNIAVIGIFIDYYRFTHANEFGKNWDPVGESYSETLASIKYFEEVDPWCNTLLSTYISGENFKDIDPGIGLSIAMYPENMTGKINSHYIFVPKHLITDWDLKEACHILFEDELNVICVRKDNLCPLAK